MENNQDLLTVDLQIDPEAQGHLTVAAKWAKFLSIIGFVFCPSRMADLMQGLLGPEFNVLALEIYDGARPSAAGLMFDDDNVRRALRENDRPSPWLARELRFGGHSWVAYFEASPSQPDAGCDRPVRPGLVQEAERQIRPRILIARPDDPTTSQSG